VQTLLILSSFKVCVILPIFWFFSFKFLKNMAYKVPNYIIL
jgi:hypothetical protein